LACHTHAIITRLELDIKPLSISTYFIELTDNRYFTDSGSASTQQAWKMKMLLPQTFCCIPHFLLGLKPAILPRNFIDITQLAIALGSTNNISDAHVYDLILENPPRMHFPGF